MISWADFEKIIIKTGTIVEVADFPNAKKPAYKLKIDFGKDGVKKSSAQITKHYKHEQLMGMQVLAVVNFEPRQIANFMSECLVLGVYDENNDVVLVQPEKKVANGCRLG